MTPYQLRQKADEFDILYPSAVQMRVRYLVSQVNQCCDWIMEESDMPQVMYGEAIEEIIALKQSLKRQNTGQKVTDDMIATAKNVKVTDILEMRHGKTFAWCHDDKRPSLTYLSRTNQAWCPVCHKFFDPIAVQMHFNGDTFQQAVINLCGA